MYACRGGPLRIRSVLTFSFPSFCSLAKKKKLITKSFPPDYHAWPFVPNLLFRCEPCQIAVPWSEVIVPTLPAPLRLSACCSLMAQSQPCLRRNWSLDMEPSSTRALLAAATLA